jgi:hypothetical protein
MSHDTLEGVPDGDDESDYRELCRRLESTLRFEKFAAAALTGALAATAGSSIRDFTYIARQCVAATVAMLDELDQWELKQ